jgi:hypothetical protein
MKKTLALIIGSVIVIAFLAVFLASDEGAPVTTPIDTATTTAVVATTTLEKTELDLSEWKLFEDQGLFVDGTEFWYPLSGSVATQTAMHLVYAVDLFL